MQNIFKIDFTDFASCILLCVYYANNVPKIFREWVMVGRCGQIFVAAAAEESSRGVLEKELPPE